ncbi:MAG: hypothetical protein Q4E65_06335 [Clostridia bacterium]|nr:hypothetical protein [Clostridia bacterium]
MMKGMDLQVMTHRPVNYTPLASEQLAKSELAGEHAARMARQSAEQQAVGVTGTEHAEEKHITEKKQREQEAREQKEKKKQQEAAEEALGLKIPSVGYAEDKLLDIEI